MDGILHHKRKGLAFCSLPKKYLCAMVGWVGESVLMDADNDRICDRFYGGDPVM